MCRPVFPALCGGRHPRQTGSARCAVAGTGAEIPRLREWAARIHGSPPGGGRTHARGYCDGRAAIRARISGAHPQAVQHLADCSHRLLRLSLYAPRLARVGGYPFRFALVCGCWRMKKVFALLAFFAAILVLVAAVPETRTPRFWHAFVEPGPLSTAHGFLGGECSG